MQQPKIGFQQVFGLMIAILNDPSDLGIDLDGSALGVIHFLCEVSPKKDLFLFFPERHRTEFFAHAPLADHTARQIGGLFDVVAGAGRHMVEHELFRDPAAEENH